MSIPDVISEAFAYETATFNGRIKRLGFKDDIEWFIYSYKERSEIGLPTLYGLKNGELKQARSFEALYIITSLVKDEIMSNPSDELCF
jgi:hypothetical protein